MKNLNTSMLTFQFINKSYRPFLSKISCYKILYRAGSESGFFQRLDPDLHQNGLDPQHWDTYINMRPGQYALYSAAACPKSIFFRVDTLKMDPAYKFKGGPVQQVKGTVPQKSVRVFDLGW
jgi:hypothetical protein